jgi:hypothetical protein
MFGGIKITLILCITIVVSFILFISHNEYTNRYYITTTNDNSVYIFDKKSTVLNRCDAKGCAVIETKLPNKMSFLNGQMFQASKLFESEKPMTTAINAQPVSVNSGNNNNQKKANDKLTPEKIKTTEEVKEKMKINNIDSKETKEEDEFVE